MNASPTSKSYIDAIAVVHEVFRDLICISYFGRGVLGSVTTVLAKKMPTHT